jgi:hypothetical protein
VGYETINDEHRNLRLGELWCEARVNGVTGPINLLNSVAAKGLEFDAVVVAGPRRLLKIRNAAIGCSTSRSHELRDTRRLFIRVHANRLNSAA